MALLGELQDVGVSDLLELLIYRGRSGTLSVRTSGEDFTFTLAGGKLVEVFSSTISIRLGKSLIRVGLLTVNDFRTALFSLEQLPGRCSLCRFLVEREYLTSGTMKPYLEEQYVETIARAMACSEGSFHFTGPAKSSTNPLAQEFDTPRMMHSATRRLQDMHVVGELLTRAPIPA